MRLKDKIENALNEGRILVLGGQVLLGAGFRAIFTEGFEKLSTYTQILLLASLSLMTVGLASMLLPAAYHYIVERGENTNSFHELVTSILEFALFPFATGLGVSVFVFAEKVASSTFGGVMGVLVAFAALGVWYVFSSLRKPGARSMQQEEPTKLKDKIKEALIEAR